MTGFPGSPRLVKGGLVLIDPATAAVRRVIVLQYNPDTLNRSFQIKAFSSESGDRSEALRLTGPPVETIKLDAEIDATDQLEFPDQNANAVQFGIFPQLAALETIASPTSGQLLANNALAQSGTLEIVPMETPLMLFVWSKQRILPVRLTDYSVTEEAFDPALNPIRAKVSLGMRVLTVDDLGFGHKGGSLFMTALQAKEQLAARSGGVLNTLGIGGHPMSAADALQALLQPNPLKTTLFPPTSRYHGIDVVTLAGTDGRPVAYLRRRIVPHPERFALLQDHTVTAGERLDTIAAHYLGDPELFWRICDANRAMRPEELTETPGRRIRITLPEGIPGVSDA